MINLLGKCLAFVQVGLSLALMALALAMYLNAVDFGWSEPARFWREAKGKKGDNLLVPSLIDKREAAMRELVRVQQVALARLGTTQNRLEGISTILGRNHLQGVEALHQVSEGPGDLKINGVKYDDTGALVLEAGSHAQLGFPSLETPVPGVTMSYASYLAELTKIDDQIAEKQKNTTDLLKKEAELTERMSGKLDNEGKVAVDKSGSVVQPGWNYLLDAEYQLQSELKKELEHVQPLWVKELVDAQLVLNRQASLLRRLNELGAQGVKSQSEFLRQQK